VLELWRCINRSAVCRWELFPQSEFFPPLDLAAFLCFLLLSLSFEEYPLARCPSFHSKVFAAASSLEEGGSGLLAFLRFRTDLNGFGQYPWRMCMRR
jgi:hypothetical protein